jgi:hypothetical protein
MLSSVVADVVVMVTAAVRLVMSSSGNSAVGTVNNAEEGVGCATGSF